MNHLLTSLGIERFRSFLVDIAANKETTDKAVLLRVLKQYCDDQSASTKNNVDFPDLLSTWSFAAQNNTDAITSAVPAVLAQFFRTINNELEFRDFGLSLCHSLLKTDQVRLIDRGLSAPKHKDFMISPCLRLVTEMVSFDAGALAANVFSRRDLLLKRLDILLDPPPRQREETNRRRPTVRRNAQRLLLALLRYLDTEAKAEMIAQGKALYACLRSLALDGGDIVRDVLKTIRLSLVNSDLQNLTKTRFLNAANLQLFAHLYDFEPEEVDSDSTVPVRQAAHDFLVQVCTSINGALVKDSGYYPPNYNVQAQQDDEEDSGIDLGLDSPYFSDDYTTSVAVKNTNLSVFLQKLKPTSDVLQAELVVKIFAAAPELVADYFCKRPKTLGAPTDDNAWLGEFGFLYSVVDLPVRLRLGYADQMPTSPPPISIVAENILPRALDRASLTAFLKKGEDIATMSAARLLFQALQKLFQVCAIFKSAPGKQHLWLQAIDKLSSIITARIPPYNELVATLQKTAKGNHMVRGALLECMSSYKTVLPQSTLSSSFDIGPLLLDVLRKLHEDDLDEDDRQALEKQEIALITIANASRGTKWWHKAGSEPLSPIMSLLLEVSSHRPNQDTELIIDLVVSSIFVEKGILRSLEQSWLALKTSLASLKPTLKDYDDTMFTFLENCMTRTMKQPVKYVEYLETVQEKVNDTRPLSLVACTIAEQWPHVLKNDDLTQTAEFVSKFFILLAVDENSAALDVLRKQMLEASETHKKHRKTLRKAFEAQRVNPISINVQPAPAITTSSLSKSTNDNKTINTTPAFRPPPPLPTTHRPLPSNYDLTSDLSTNPSTSRLATLILSLSSPISEVHLGALTTLTTLHSTLLTSTYPEATQLHLLLGILLLTYRQHSQAQAQKSLGNTNNTTTTHLPSLITSLTLFALTTLTSPSSPLYAKTNRLLLSSPTFHPLPKLLPHWLSLLLYTESDSDVPQQSDTDIVRFLDAVADGIRAPEDAELCRKAGLWEKLGCLMLRVGVKREVRKGVLRCLWVAAGVEGGPGTLVTRVGVRGWLDVVEGRERGEMRELVGLVRERIEVGLDVEELRGWEGKERVVEKQVGDRTDVVMVD